VTINIGGHRHLNDAPLKTTQIASDVRRILPIDPALPTLIALQETTRVWRDTFSQSDGEALAQQLGTPYRFLFAPEVDSAVHAHQRIWQRPMYKGYSRVENGNGVVTNLSPAAWAWAVPAEGYPGAGGAPLISTTINRAKIYSTGSRDTQPRNLMLTCVESPFGALYFMNTHLSTLGGEERRDPQHSISQKAIQARMFEAEQILGIVHELRAAEHEANIAPRPIIFAGDFNAEASTPEMQTLQRTFTLIPPPASEDGTHLKHKIHIDHILMADPAHKLPPVQRCFVNTAPEVAEVTDHRPVIAVLGKP
jgi:endonuclease/exonuclease/phosphatase family metal-dependent hydrolase